MNGFRAYDIDNRVYILKDCDRLPCRYTNVNGERGKIENANFRNTGMALCGKLRKKQTMEQFIEQYNAKKSTKKRRKNVNN